MAVTFFAFTPPENIGGSVDVTLIGDPVFAVGDQIFLLPYGAYIVRERRSDQALLREYRFELIGKGTPGLVPRGVLAVTEAEGVTHSVLPYSSTIFLNFKGRDYRTLDLAGDITLATQRHEPAKSIVVKIRNLSGTVSRNLSFPASWIFIGSAGRPTTIGPSKTGILSITCFGMSDADVIAAWGVQPG